jgi:hypothetical protein
MMYKKNYVLALKIGGKILRESNERVELPFGYEYSVLIKNLHGVRATAALTVNGSEIGTFIVPANGEIEVERFMKNGNMHAGNKFKFIERTASIEAARGIKVDDGLVRVEFKKEKIYVAPSQFVWSYDPWRPHYVDFPSLGSFTNHTTRTILRSTPERMIVNSSLSGMRSGSGVGGVCGQSASSNNVSYESQNMNSVVGASAISNDAGITVPGSASNQQFQVASWFPTETESEVLVLHLVGTHGKKKVQTPLTVDIRPVCQTCQKRSKSDAHFCKHCGTSLHII